MPPPVCPPQPRVTALHDTLLATPSWPAHEPAAARRRGCGCGSRPITASTACCGPRKTWRAARTVGDARDRRQQARDRPLQPGAQRRHRARRRVAAHGARPGRPGLGAHRCAGVDRAAGSRLNSETAGSMVDRLSILALKVHAMRAQTERRDVDEAHRATQPRQARAAAAAARRPGRLPRRAAGRLPRRAARTSRSTASSRCTTTRASIRRWCRSDNNVALESHAHPDRQDVVDGRRGACAAGRCTTSARPCPTRRSSGWSSRRSLRFRACIPASIACMPLAWRRWRTQAVRPATTWKAMARAARATARSSRTTACSTCRA